MLLENRKNDTSQEDMHSKSEIDHGRYCYKVFGLHITSDILLPELLTTLNRPGMPEVNIVLGKVPTEITDPIEKEDGYQVAKNQFLLRVAGVGCYYVTNGNCIIVEPMEEGEERLVRIFLLGTAFGALLIQRGILPIHGSAVVVDGGCMIFTGVSGAGKSTLLAAFRERGYSFLTDDVAAVTVDENGVPWVHAAYPQQKLWRDSAENIGVDTASLIPFYSGMDRDKFAVPIHKGFLSSPMPLVAVYELEAERCRDVTLKPLTGMDKLAVLMSHTYRPWLFEGLCLKAAHFRQCVSVAKEITVSCLTRPVGEFSLEEQVRLVLQDLKSVRADRAV